MIRKKINQAKKLVSDWVAFRELNSYDPPTSQNNLLVNFENPQLYHRFFYLLLKFYKISGYNIYYPLSFSKFRNLRNKDQYLALIVREKNFLSVNKNKLPDQFIEINDQMFSADYFSHYFEQNNRVSDAFHIPMSFHPLMYHKEIWNIKVNTDRKRLNSVFCYGNFDQKAYSEIEKTDFKVIPRTELLSFFKEKQQFLSINSREEIIAGNSDLNEKFTFAIKENFQIEMREIRELLSYFNFYLCCPGVVMPLCHNVVEAMSVGTIPLIEKEYAEVMYPHLENNVNAIIFEGLENLEKIVSEEIFNLPEDEIIKMRQNALAYYNEFLSPLNVVTAANQNIKEKNTIYLQAEHRSIRFKDYRFYV